MKKGDVITEVIFKHSRFNFIQSIYGGLTEDGSLEAVEKTEERLDCLFEEIKALEVDDKNFTNGKAIELCFNRAQTTEELLIFVYTVASESSCPTHPFLEMLKKGSQREG